CFQPSRIDTTIKGCGAFAAQNVIGRGVETVQVDKSLLESNRRRSSKADCLVDTAVRLFYKNGFHATGIQELLDAAGVSKMTLYGNFASKDELILAALRRRDTDFRTWFERRTHERAAEPRKRLLAMFDTLDEWIRSDEFFGCLFINASAEFSAADSAVHRLCVEHKNMVLAYITATAVAAGALLPDILGGQLFLLAEGAIVDAHVRLNKNAALDAKDAAEVLVANGI
ncbi:MAG: TetR/AcrR family transcriptional regulator, partial [Proteobacteria bacterium]|nr:TetR/AcrR family transcriptional regulator [Pseudomonadota bacterium]